VVLSGGALVVTGTGSGSSVSLDKEVRVVTSGQLIAEGAALNISKLSVAQAGAAHISGDITATAVDVSGSLTLSGNSPLHAQTLSAGSGATFVWDKPTLSGAQGIVITGDTATDLSASTVQFSKGFVSKALAETGSLNSGGLYSGTLVVGNFVTSNGTVSAPSTVVQPQGIVSFKLVSRDEQKAIDLVLERTSFRQLLPSGGASGFGQALDGLSGDGLRALLAAIPAGADTKTVQEILKRADGGATFASVSAVAPAQALAVSASVDIHLDDLSAGGGGSSMSMGVRVGAPSKSTVPMSSPIGDDYDRNWKVWTSGYGSWGRTSADAAGNGKSTSSGGGGSIGLERQMGDLMAGFLVSVGESVTRADDPYLRVKSDSWNLGGYGSMNIGAVTLDASALWGTSEQDSQRQGVAGPGVSGLASAKYSSQNWQTGIGIAANLAPKDSSWQVSPVARLKYINSSEDGFSETGSALAVGSSAHNDSHVLSKLGLRLAKNSQLSSSVLLGLDAAAYWVHDYNSEGRDLQFTLGGSTYTSRTRDRQPDSAQFNLGLQATFSDMVMLRLSGQQDVNEERRQTTGLFTVAYKF
jgi:outer membrane autotransporter protein